MSTLSELRTRARRRADAVGNNFFSDAEISDYINTGLGELHDLLVDKFEDYYVANVSFPLVSGTSTYSFDDIGLANFYKLLGVDLLNGTDTVRLGRYAFQERNAYEAGDRLLSLGGYTTHLYSLKGKQIEFIPEPSSTDTVKIWYVPTFVKLDGDDDSNDDRLAYNWEEYAVVSAAIKMRQKEETGTSTLEKELARIDSRIEEAARNRDAGESIGIIDIHVGTYTPNRNWS